MIIGKFKSTKNGYEGSIATLGIVLGGVVFEAVNAPRGKGPNYVIRSGNGAEFGFAWNRTSDKTGTAYVSASLYSPFLAGPVYTRLFESKKEPGTFDLIWNEPKPKKDDQPAQA